MISWGKALGLDCLGLVGERWKGGRGDRTGARGRENLTCYSNWYLDFLYLTSEHISN